GGSSTTFPRPHRSGKSRPRSFPHGRVRRCDYQRFARQMSAISASAVEPPILPFGSIEWFKRELAPTRLRKIRTAIMVGAAVLCVIISMTLQVPELSVTAYMPFFMSKESKFLTTLTGVIGLIGLTIGVGVSLL